MILGRNTVQWTALITAAASLVQTLIITLMPEIDAKVVGVVLGAIIAFLGIAIAFIANTSTTPSDDPRLKANTPVTIVNKQGATVGRSTVPDPQHD